MSQDQTQKAANKKRDEERAVAIAAGEEYVRTAALLSAFSTNPDPSSSMFFTGSEVFVSDQNRPGYGQSQSRTTPPATTLESSSSTSSTAQTSYAPLQSCSDDSSILQSYANQRTATFFAPPKKIVEQEQQEERVLRYIVAGTLFSGIGAGLLVAGCFTLYCPPLAGGLITAGLVLKAIGLFCFAMAAAISLRTEKQNTVNGHELQDVFADTFGHESTTPNHSEHVFA